MNEFYAADPRSCDRSADLRFLLNHFGPQTGRYLADYPASWALDIERHCALLGEVEAERIKLLIRRARERSALLRKNALPWQDGMDWLENYKSLISRRPGEFELAVVPRAAKVQGQGLTTIDEFELPPTADEAIEATASEYVRVSRTLLLISPELTLVDPYLNPCKSDRYEVLRELFSVAAKGKCQRITCWARDTEVVDSRRNTWEEVSAALMRLLKEIAWPSEKAFRYVLVDDARARSKMHPRYLFSIKGGIRFDQGFQRLPKGRRNDVSPLGAAVHDELMRTYHEGAHDMQLERAFEHGGRP